eukprot:6081216-Ditylum_brightwellii.AAC.1
MSEGEPRGEGWAVGSGHSRLLDSLILCTLMERMTLWGAIELKGVTRGSILVIPFKAHDLEGYFG